MITTSLLLSYWFELLADTPGMLLAQVISYKIRLGSQGNEDICGYGWRENTLGHVWCLFLILYWVFLLTSWIHLFIFVFSSCGLCLFHKNPSFFFLCKSLLKTSYQKMAFSGVTFKFLRYFMCLRNLLPEKNLSFIFKNIPFSLYKPRVVAVLLGANLFWFFREKFHCNNFVCQSGYQFTENKMIVS